MKLVFATLKGLSNQPRWRALLLAERSEGEPTCKKQHFKLQECLPIHVVEQQHLEDYSRLPLLSKQQREKYFRNSSKGVSTIILRVECEDGNTI